MKNPVRILRKKYQNLSENSQFALILVGIFIFGSSVVWLPNAIHYIYIALGHETSWVAPNFLIFPDSGIHRAR